MIKTQQKYPSVMEKCNITSLHKKKSKRDFDNYRGVFRVQILRSILDKLMYNDSYYTIDSNLTDGNVGARKQRSVRDNIFVISAITNSVRNGTSAPIQVQVMDAIKCFDKLWLQSCVNSLYEAGITNDILNILYIENKNAMIAVKVNNKLSTRIAVKDVVMQGSVWGSLKCTSTMDKLNQIAMDKRSLQYKYMGDPNIPIGVLGMVDDTLAVSECGYQAIRKNAVVNSFMETQRLRLSVEKSVVLHYGKEGKCALPCPDLKVHKETMMKKESTRYLGQILSTQGGLHDTIEDRRQKGWGIIASIEGLLSEVDMGVHKVEAGLLLRQSLLHSSILYSAEAWSGLTDKQLARLEVVDTSLIRRLTGGHSKCAVEYHHMETGTWKLRHHLTFRRLMYHHHLLSRGNTETIKKIYLKQKEKSIKGDWISLLKSDFKFLNIDINEEIITATPKSEYSKNIKKLINNAVFSYYQTLQQTHSKLDEVDYSELKIQPYLVSNSLNNEEKQLLYNMRSNCHSSKINFKKMYKNDTKCTLKCPQDEDQRHIFMQCQPLLSLVEQSGLISYEDIFQTLEKQIVTIKSFIQIEQLRNHIKNKHFSPGGKICQDPCTFGFISNGAADIFSS